MDGHQDRFVVPMPETQAHKAALIAGDGYRPISFEEMCQHFAQLVAGHVVTKRKSYGEEAVLDQGVEGQARRIREKAARVINLHQQAADPHAPDGILQEFIDLAGCALTGYAMAQGWWIKTISSPPLLDR